LGRCALQSCRRAAWRVSGKQGYMGAVCRVLTSRGHMGAAWRVSANQGYMAAVCRVLTSRGYIGATAG